MSYYDKHTVYFGDLHNHCDISYGKGSLQDAFFNAKQNLDFCSVTGHADWPDLPDCSERSQSIKNYHHDGFDKLKRGWKETTKYVKSQNIDGEFISFLGFEIHSRTFGDYTIVYKNLDGEIIHGKNVPALKKVLKTIQDSGNDGIAFPHHISYIKGGRGINWSAFTEPFTPIVEIFSSHGGSETDPCTRPPMGVLGPSDWGSCMQYGLSKGNIFGVVANTDHHHAHPGSYGHGKTGVWAKDLTRESLWNAIQQRRTYALTGDTIQLEFSINDSPMGSVIPPADKYSISGKVVGGAAIDYVDIIKNNRLLKRFSPCDFQTDAPTKTIRTKLYLEMGWGHDYDYCHWLAEFGISEGKIIGVEPRFRGMAKFSSHLALEGKSKEKILSNWKYIDDKTIFVEAETWGNPSYETNTCQGICIEVDLPLSADVTLNINGMQKTIALKRLFEGSKSEMLGDEMEFPAWKLHKAPLPHEYNWKLYFEDYSENNSDTDFYYIKVRQINDQWAWSSPIFIRGEA